MLCLGLFAPKALALSELADEKNGVQKDMQLSNQQAAQQYKPLDSEYKISASFFALPIDAKIRIEKLQQKIYRATVIIRSPFFDLDQIETVEVEQCNVRLVELSSEGNRVGVDDWQDKAVVEWPNKKVNYHRKDKQSSQYRVRLAPSGFTSFFAHQYTSLMKKEIEKQVAYLNDKRGVVNHYRYQGRDQKVKTKLYRKKIEADRFVILRKKGDEKDFPNIWYQPEKIGAFPLKMKMKLGVFTIEAQLKKLHASNDEVLAFFDEWGCSS